MGIGDLNPVTALINSVTPIIDDMFTTEEERSAAKLKLLELMQQTDLAQMAVNAEEAQHDSLFVAGWRPFVGWTCAAALCMSFILFPLIQTCAVYYGQFTGVEVSTSELPDLDWATLGPVLLGMLGLGGLRTTEKIKGVARKAVKKVVKKPAPDGMSAYELK